jgi:hypothetical protein
MARGEFVEYCGERFYIQTTRRYFSSGRKDVAERLLHRRVWSDAHGPIPPGMSVHHKDGDWRNNSLDNLDLLPVGVHMSGHMRERWEDETQRAAFMAGLEKAREAAKGWHSSEEGRTWHRRHGRSSWASVERQDIVCACCAKVFRGYPSAGAKLCSKACRQKHSYPNRFSVERKCAACDAEYKASRYRQARFCSRACSNRSRGLMVASASQGS